MAESDQLVGEDLCLAYDHHEVTSHLSVAIPPGRITVIVGPNACGKSTLLRALARLLRAEAGHRAARRHVDPPSADAAGGDDARDPPAVPDRPGRHLGRRPCRAAGAIPHQRWIRSWTAEDRAAIDGALAATGTADIAGRPVDELSGGQRQRVWIAMTLAQGTELMLLDEPTTYLDLAHQVEVLDLLVDLNQREGRTIVLVLHDLNHACRYAHHLIAMRDGGDRRRGLTRRHRHAELDDRGLRPAVPGDHRPGSGTPMVVPIGQHIHVRSRASAG